MSGMNLLNQNADLFGRLAGNPPRWWTALKGDPDVSIQIRKNNTIDVYYNGGAIIRSLSYSRGRFHGEIHHKYIPVHCRGKEGYVEYSFDGGIEFGKVEPVGVQDFSAPVLRKIKSNIANHYPNESEKGIQYLFVKNDPFYLDSEFQHGNQMRIDLVRIDAKSGKIVFVEVKTMGDTRLYTEEITRQLNAYMAFAREHKEALLAYYRKVFEIKKQLGVLSRGLLTIGDLGDYQMHEKPLLLFGDCSQAWIDGLSGKLDERIRHCALGAYYFGAPKYAADIIPGTKGNRHIY